MKKFMLITILMAAAMSFVGCQTATPSKAQSAVVKADYITVNGAGNRELYEMLAKVDNLTSDSILQIIQAATDLAKVSEINVVSQTMSNETGGNESNSQTATNEPNIPVSIPTGTDAITALVSAGAEGITKGLSSEDTDTTSTTNASDSSASNSNCADGNCTP